MTEQLFQVGVKGLIRNDKNQILMVHNEKAYWDLPGGRMEPGETFEDTLSRELLEEIGGRIAGKAIWFTTTLTDITIPVGGARYPLILTVFEVNLSNENELKVSATGPEDGFEWFTPSDVAENLKHKYSSDFCDLIVEH